MSVLKNFKTTPRSPYGGATGGYFLNFSKRTYIFEILIFFKYKKEKRARPAAAELCLATPRCAAAHLDASTPCPCPSSPGQPCALPCRPSWHPDPRAQLASRPGYATTALRHLFLSLSPPRRTGADREAPITKLDITNIY